MNWHEVHRHAPGDRDPRGTLVSRHRTAAEAERALLEAPVVPGAWLARWRAPRLHPEPDHDSRTVGPVRSLDRETTCAACRYPLTCGTTRVVWLPEGVFCSKACAASGVVRVVLHRAFVQQGAES